MVYTMKRITRAQVCVANNHTGELQVRSEYRIDLDNIEFTGNSEQFIAIGYRHLDWSETGHWTAVIVVLDVENTETGEVSTLEFNCYNERIQKIF